MTQNARAHIHLAKATAVTISTSQHSDNVGILTVATDKGIFSFQIDQDNAAAIVDEILTFLGSPPD
jgi:hypothetical protein